MIEIEQSSSQRVEHARDAAYLQSHPRLQSALLGYKEALLEYKEALQKFEEALNRDESQAPNGQSLRLLSFLTECASLKRPGSHPALLARNSKRTIVIIE